MSNQEQFNLLFNPDENGNSRWVERSELESNPLTSRSMGGNGCGRHGVYFGRSDYNWEIRRGRHNRVEAVRTIGFSNNNNNGGRPIRGDIKRHYRQISCVVCGSYSSLVCDHKNDLYNDPRVLNSQTQTLDDFQSLCNACNLRKRAVNRRTRETGLRQPPPPSIRVLGIDFTRGDENYDPDDINAMVGTYWYDPLAFMIEVRNILTNQNQ